LGYVYFPQTISRLELLASAAEFDRQEHAVLDNSDETALSFANEMISKSLSKNEINDFWPGDEYYNAEVSIPDRLKYIIHVRKPVYLLLTHNGEQIELKLDISGEYQKCVGFKYREPEVYRCGQTPTEDEVVMPAGRGCTAGR
jgi:hypothetical protein